MTLVGVYKILPSGNDDEVEQTLQNFVCKMFIIGRAVCFILALIVTVIAIITNSQNHTRRVPPPKPFFTRETWVEDFYEGELYYALLKATKYDVIFLMLYAPWDADSQKARSEFETACRYFQKKVYCAAVNCWQANTRCKAVFDNIATYPMFLVDLYNVPSIKYNGEFIASHMIRFLSTIMKPLERINSVEKFQTLNTMCDTLVVSFLPDYKWYRRYYSASLRHIEYDPRRDICWSVITDPVLAYTLDMKPFSVKLHTWNETKVYGHSFLDKQIAKWVHDNTNFLTRWVFFKNARSTSLAELLENNPAIILFTPRNMHLNYIPSYLVFKEAAMEFQSCSKVGGIENNRPSSAKQWQKIIEEYHQWEHVCKLRFSLKNAFYNATIFDLIRQNYEKYVFTSIHSENTTTWGCLPNTCDTSRKSTLGAEVITSMLDWSEDDRSPQNLVLRHIREKCRQLNMLKSTFNYSYFTNTPSFSKPESVLSASCRVNKTISFFAIDSLLNSHFATALGINLENYEDRTAVVIFDNRNEETYVLGENLRSTKTIHEFLVNFTLRIIPRWIKSTEDSSLYLNRYKRLENPTGDEVLVQELNSRTFESVVFNSPQHVVVYFYSPYCGYCQVSAYTFLSAAYKLRNIPQITFARVDGENNDLPWYLVPLNYPTIMIFPANKKSESIVFPQSLEITAENVYEFLLSNIDAEIRLKAMLDECNLHKNNLQVSYDALDECVTRVKTYCLQLINKLMDKYKKVAVNSTAAHDKMLSRLKFFKTFYLSIENF